MHGANGEDTILRVPTGTIIRDAETQEIIFDLDEKNTKVLMAEGGRG